MLIRWGSSGLAFLHSPPVVWGAVVAAAFLILLRSPLDQRSLPAAGRQLPEGERLGAAVGIAFAPVFLANLVFAQRFRDVGSSTVAFGANLLGAMVGGVLEYTALVTGYRALLAVVFGLYLLAFLARPRLAKLLPVG